MNAVSGDALGGGVHLWWKLLPIGAPVPSPRLSMFKFPTPGVLRDSWLPEVTRTIPRLIYWAPFLKPWGAWGGLGVSLGGPGVLWGIFGRLRVTKEPHNDAHTNVSTNETLILHELSQMSVTFVG